MIWLRLVWYWLWRGVVCGALFGAAYGAFLLPLVGTLNGFLYGTLIGLIMGVIDACVISTITHLFLNVKNPTALVPWLRFVGVVLTFEGIYMYMLLLKVSDPLSIVPSVLAAIVIYVLCPHFVKFAAHTQQLSANQKDVQALQAQQGRRTSLIWLRLISWMWARGTVSGAVLGTVFGTLLAPVFGTILGLFYGVILGASTGFVSGVALVALMRFRFYPPEDNLNFQSNAVITALICTLMTSLPLVARMMGGIRYLPILPPIIAAIAAGFFAWQFPRYAQSEFALRNPTVNVLL